MGEVSEAGALQGPHDARVEGRAANQNTSAISGIV